MSDKILKPAIHGHDSHGFGDAVTGHHGTNIAQNGAPKKVHSVPIHGGMAKQTKSGFVAGGGQHASALDAMSGATVPQRGNQTAPGWGNAGVQSGSPFAKAPGSKRTVAAPPSFGQRSRGPVRDNAMHNLGEAMIAEAFAASGSDDRAAHGRKRDGSK